jgi:hypothetical protein
MERGTVYFYAEDDIESVVLSGGDDSDSIASDETLDNNEENGVDSPDEEDKEEVSYLTRIC